jgi:hypothetical protein
VAGLPIAGWIGVTLAILAVVLGAGAWFTYGRGGRVPPVAGFYSSRQITFSHTEASDPKVAKLLTGMKASPVIFVPQLAEVPDSALAKVYVFKNGIKGGGPFGFQPDVFDSVPGDQGYRPLRALQLVTWNKGGKAKVLRSAGEIEAATTRGQLHIDQPGVVINMPLLTWPGGHR